MKTVLFGVVVFQQLTSLRNHQRFLFPVWFAEMGVDDRGRNKIIYEHFLEFWKILGRVDAKIIHKASRHRIDQRFSRKVFVSSSNNDEFFFKKLLDRVVAIYPPDGLDFPFGNRLLIR